MADNTLFWSFSGSAKVLPSHLATGDQTNRNISAQLHQGEFPPAMRPRSLSALASHAVKAAPAGGLAPGLDLFDRSGVWEPRRWLRGESSPTDALRAGSQSEMQIGLIPALG